jgi:sphingolipid 8-(E)-desaturase
MSTPKRTSRYKDEILSRNDVECLIAEGRKIVVVDERVLKVDAWLPYHPGGDKAILHMVGRDATNEVRAFHSRETQELMHKYQIGRVEGQWKDFVPPIQGGVFNKMTQVSTKDQSQDSNQDMSDEERSQEPSPIFEGSEHRTSSFRRRRGSDAGVSESSATSIDSLELEEPTIRKDQSNADIRKQTELEQDLEIFPSLDPTTQQGIVNKYRALDARIRAAGLYNCNYTAYAIECTRYLILAVASYTFLQYGYYTFSAIFLGLFWHQLVFTVHDAGHMGITHHFHVDTVIGILIANFLGGLSVCWWKRNHNVHHIVTNSPSHDPDIQHMPFFAVSTEFFESLRSTYYECVMKYDAVAKFALQWQHWLYYPLLTFGRFNLYVLSWQYILLGQGPRKGPAWWHRYLELAGQLFFWYWFGYRLLYLSLPDNSTRFLYLLVSHAVTMPVHVQITLSHFAMSTADLGVAESFPQRMLRTTMDVDCPAWLDFIHGGLQFQAVHHLYPRIPRHNLRGCQKLVIDFCEDVGIPYAIYGFGEGNGKVIGRLGEVAKQARILAECQRAVGVKDLLEAH